MSEPRIADVPSPIDLYDPKDAAEWAAAAMPKRPWRGDFFVRFAEHVSTLAGRRVLELGSGPSFLAEVILRSVSGVYYSLLSFSPATHDLERHFNHPVPEAGEAARTRADYVQYHAHEFARYGNWRRGQTGNSRVQKI